MIKERVKDDLDGKLEKHKKWANFIITSDGRTGWGALVYNSEEDAATMGKFTMEGQRVSELPPDMLMNMWSKPNMQGGTIIYKNKELVSKFPMPI